MLLDKISHVDVSVYSRAVTICHLQRNKSHYMFKCLIARVCFFYPFLLYFFLFYPLTYYQIVLSLQFSALWAQTKASNLLAARQQRNGEKQWSLEDLAPSV